MVIAGRSSGLGPTLLTLNLTSLSRYSFRAVFPKMKKKARRRQTVNNSFVIMRNIFVFDYSSKGTFPVLLCRAAQC